MSQPDQALPFSQRFFEDYEIGTSSTFGTVTIDQDAIIAFAERYDPQAIHTDPAAAAAGPFGGLIASGWHTASQIMRLLVTNYLSHVASIASPGIDELRWLKPVRPGDALRVRVTTTDATRSRSKPDRGMLRSLIEVFNQNDEMVMSMKAMNVIRCRTAEPPAP